MSIVNPDDLFAVNRNDITYSVEQQNLMASLENTDYLAVNRDDVTYKITGQEFIESVVDPLEIAPTVSSAEEAQGIVATVQENAFGGKQPFSYTYQWNYKVTDTSDPIDFDGATSKTFLIPSNFHTYDVGCFVTVTDGLGSTASGQSNYIKVAQPPRILSVTLTENNDGGQRPLTTDEIVGVTESDPGSELVGNSDDGGDKYSGGYFTTSANNWLLSNNITHITGFRLIGGPYTATINTANGATETKFNGVSHKTAGIVVTQEYGDVFSSADYGFTNFFSSSALGYVQGGVNDGNGYWCEIEPFEINNLQIATNCYADGTTYGIVIRDQNNRWVNFLGELQPVEVDLTLAGDKDLTFLAAGMAVKQDDSPLTLETSEITSITGSTKQFDEGGDTVVGLGNYNAFKTILFEQNTGVYVFRHKASDSTTNWFFSDEGHTYVQTHSNQQQFNTTGWRGDGSGSDNKLSMFNNFATANSATEGYNTYSAVGLTAAVSGNPWTFHVDTDQRKVWISVDNGSTWVGGGSPSENTNPTFVYTHPELTNIKFWSTVYQTSLQNILSSNNTLLTFADDTDLAKFEPGDVIDSGSSVTVTQFVGGLSDTGVANSKTGAKYRVSGADIFRDYTDDSETVTLGKLFGGASWNMLWYQSTGLTTTDAEVASSRNATESDTVGSWKTVLVANKYYSFSYYGVNQSFPSTDKGPIGSDIATPITFTKEVKVVSVDADNNQMTVDGGKWNDGSGNQSQVWSANSSQVNEPSLAFDSNMSTFAYGNANQAASFTFDPPLVVTEGFVLYDNCLGNWTAHTTDNGTQVGSVSASLDFNVPAVMPCSGTIEYIYFTASGGSRMELAKVEADGVTLIDKGIGGDSTVTTTKTITGTVGSFDAAGRTITLSESNGNWSANTGNYVVGPEIAFSDGPRFTNQSFNVNTRNRATSTTPISYSVKPIIKAQLLQDAQTDVITAVSANSLNTAQVFSDGNDSTNTDGFPENMPVLLVDDFFNRQGVGSVSLQEYLDVTNWTASGDGVRIWTAATADASGTDWKDTYGGALAEVANWTNEIQTRKFGPYLLIMSSGDNSNLRFTPIGDVSVEASKTTLTFKSDRDLEYLQVGDTLNQISDKPPETSAITNVQNYGSSPYSYSSNVAYTNSAEYPSNPPSNYFAISSSQWSIQSAGADGAYHADIDLGAEVSISSVFINYAGLEQGGPGGTINPPCFIWFDKDTSTAIEFPTSFPSDAVFFTQQLTRYISIGFIAGRGDTDQIVGSSGSYFTLRGKGMFLNGVMDPSGQFYVDGTQLIDNTSVFSSAELTLTDNTNLKNFRVGDATQKSQGGSEPYVLPNPIEITAPLNGNVAPVFSNSGPGYIRPAGEQYGLRFNTTIEVVVDDVVTFQTIGRTNNPWTFQTINDDTGEVKSYTGNFASDIGWGNACSEGEVHTVNIASAGRIYKYFVSNGGSGSDAGICWFALNGNKIYDGSTITKPAAVPVNVVAVNESDNKLIVNGGTWALGDVVRLPDPDVQAASGTIQSIDDGASAIKLLSSAGRWLVTEANYQETKKINAVARANTQVVKESLLYPVIDSEGYVSDLSETDRGYKLMVTGSSINEDVTLTFPNLLPSGETPDTALPEGTAIATDVLCANSVGQDGAFHGDTGAELVPVDTGAPEGKFKPVIYAGNNGAQSISVGFPPDLVWIKSRNVANDHGLFDTVRGAGKGLYSDLTNAEFDVPETLSSFDSNGFSLGNNSTYNGSDDYVAWCWSAGDTTVTNNDGTIASQVRAGNGFSIVSWTGTGLSGSIGHGLEDVPGLILTKCLNQAPTRWYSRHGTFAANEYINLDQTDGKQVGAMWDNTLPSSDVIYLSGADSDTDRDAVNRLDNQYIAYCFAETATSSFGSYTGNGSTTGPTIECGFEPAFVMIKCSSAEGAWEIFDSARSPSNPRTAYLKPNDSDVESNANSILFNSNGFQPNKDDAYTNQSGLTYIYAAFAGTTTRFDARDAADVAKYEAIEAKLNAYPDNRDNFRSGIRHSVLASNLSPAEKAYLMSDTI